MRAWFPLVAKSSCHVARGRRFPKSAIWTGQSTSCICVFPTRKRRPRLASCFSRLWPPFCPESFQTVSKNRDTTNFRPCFLAFPLGLAVSKTNPSPPLRGLAAAGSDEEPQALCVARPPVFWWRLKRAIRRRAVASKKAIRKYLVALQGVCWL